MSLAAILHQLGVPPPACQHGASGLVAPGRGSGDGAARFLVTVGVFVLSAAGALPARAHVPRVVCLGDSITYGVVRSARRGHPMRVDRAGGFPGRAQHRLGQRARVLGRGIGGATTRLWLSDPMNAQGHAVWTILPTLWRARSWQPGLPEGASLASAVLEHDRADVAVILLGINDIASEARTRGPAIVDDVADRLDTIHDQAAAVARTTLLATALPNHRDPADLIARLNATIRARHPDLLPLGERFGAVRWGHLLGDEVHPNARGYRLLARILVRELRARGLVDCPGFRGVAAPLTAPCR